MKELTDAIRKATNIIDLNYSTPLTRTNKERDVIRENAKLIRKLAKRIEIYSNN